MKSADRPMPYGDVVRNHFCARRSASAQKSKRAEIHARKLNPHVVRRIPNRKIADAESFEARPARRPSAVPLVAARRMQNLTRKM